MRGYVQAAIANFFAGTPKWKHPPHEYLAGMELTDWNVERFAPLRWSTAH